MKGVVGAYLRDAPQNKNANRSRCVSPRRTPQARMPPTDSREHRNRSRRRSPRCALATALFISNTETTELTEVFLSQLKNMFSVGSAISVFDITQECVFSRRHHFFQEIFIVTKFRNSNFRDKQKRKKDFIFDCQKFWNLGISLLRSLL